VNSTVYSCAGQAGGPPGGVRPHLPARPQGLSADRGQFLGSARDTNQASKPSVYTKDV